MNRLNHFHFSLVFIALGATQCSVFEPPNMARQDSGSAVEGGTGGTDGTGGTGGTSGTGGTGGGTGGTINGGNGGDEQWWIVTNEHGCKSVRAPTKADRPEDAYDGENIAPIYVALSRVNLGANKDDEASTEDPNAWKTFGFDRDGRCTSSPTCCIDPTKCEEDDDRVDEPSCKTELGGIAAEGDYCIDNVMGSLFSIGFSFTSLPSSPFALLGMTPADWNCELHRGGFSMILKISNYNGTKYDPFVRLDMYISTGLQELDKRGWTCRADIQSPLFPGWYEYPRWLPSRHWKIAKRSISLASEPVDNEVPDSVTFDSTAFVRGGYLFAELPDAQEFTFAGDNTPIPGFRNIMYNPVLLAKLILDPDEKAWRMEDGVLSFYIQSSDFLRSFREVGFCENVCGMPETLKGYADLSKDVLLSGEMLPNVPCDALSLATKFQAHQVTATAEDVEEIDEPMECPPLRNPDMPPYGCVCQENGSCVLPEGGITDGATPVSAISEDAGAESGI